MSNIYKYIGKIPVLLPALGEIQPDETVETNLTIDNPLFKKINTSFKTNKKNKKN